VTRSLGLRPVSGLRREYGRVWPRQNRVGGGRREAATLLAVLAALALAQAAAGATPRVDARAWFVQNAATGEVLLAHNERARVPIASITKLMTVLVALERAPLDDVVTVTSRSASIGGSTIHLRPGERISVRDLVEAALIQSANDAASALAVHVGDGSEARFVELMNAKARALGLTATQFVRPDGLDAPGHFSTARDVTKLARVVMHQPVVRDIVARRTELAAGRLLRNWNDLLGTFPGLIGVKTGHTSGAGWSQVAAARGRGLTIYAAILGSPTRSRRNADLTELLAWGLSRYRVVPVVRSGRVYAQAETEFGRPPVGLVADRPLVRVVRVDRPLVERVVAPLAVPLPVRRGQTLGEVQIWAGAKLLGARPLVASESMHDPGLAGRIRWYAGRTLRNAWDLVA
jgi:serine-type D-Ala-D-Ala carboxypeptidase (penicillin-binding protein 5/6)